MKDKNKIREYKDDNFEIYCIYDEKGEKLTDVIEKAFKSYYDLKINI